MRRTSNSIIFLLACSLLLQACSNDKKPGRPTPNVTTTAINQQDVPIYIDTIGQVIAPSTVYIRPQVAGKLIKAYVEQGAIVKEGDVIFEIDPRPYQELYEEAVAQLAHDKALLAYAEQAVERNRKVLEQDFISIINFEQYLSNAAAAKAQVDQDEAAIRYAMINVDFCKIVAPVSGKLSYMNVYVGNVLAINDPSQITTILPFSPIDVTFSLPQQQFELIRQVQGNAGEWKFVAALPEYPKQLFEGTTYFIDNQIDQNTGTILLKGRLPNDERKLWPGEFIRVKVLYQMAPGALTVPPSSVLIGRDGPYIYTVDKDNKAIVHIVTVLTRTEEYIAIQSDSVHQGDTVVVDGQINLAPDMVVNKV